MKMCDPMDCDCPFSDPNECIQHMKPDGMYDDPCPAGEFETIFCSKQILRSYIASIATDLRDLDAKLEKVMNPYLAHWERRLVPI